MSYNLGILVDMFPDLVDEHCIENGSDYTDQPEIVHGTGFQWSKDQRRDQVESRECCNLGIPLELR